MGASGNHKGTRSSSNRRVQDVSEYKDEAMTRAAREARIAWRLQNLAEWHRGLLSLGHYRAEYPYDVAHEYDHDWTTDSDYVWTKVHRREYDEDGHEFLRLRDTFFLWDTERTSLDRLGNRVVVKPDVYFDEDVAARLNLFTRQGSPKNVTVPDLAVLLPEYELPRKEWRPLNDCVFRLGLGDPAPELVLQHLSTTVDWQRNSKLRLYMRLSESSNTWCTTPAACGSRGHRWGCWLTDLRTGRTALSNRIPICPNRTCRRSRARCSGRISASSRSLHIEPPRI